MPAPQPTPHVFLSYSRGDRETAARLARALGDQGLRIWWDVDIPTGVHYPKYIEDGLKSAACVVVLWSRQSTASRWVRNEADWGAEHDTLVPVIIDGTEIPWEFRNFQTADLTRWRGDADDPAFVNLLAGLRIRLEAAGGSAPEAVPPPRPAAKPPSPQAPKAGISMPRLAIGAVLLLIAALALSRLPLGSWLSGGSERGRELDFSHVSFEPLTGDGRTHSSAISPDGRFLAFTRMDATGIQLRLKQIDTGTETVLASSRPQGIRAPLFSRDGEHVYFTMLDPASPEGATSPFSLFRVSLLGGDLLRIAADVVDRRFDLSPDGAAVVFKRHVGDSTLVLVASRDGAGERRVASERRDNAFRQCVAWSADGAEILTARRDGDKGRVMLVGLPVGGGPERVLPGDRWQTVMDLRPLPGAAGLLVLGKPESAQGLNINLWLVPDGSGAYRQLTNDVTMYYQVTTDATGSRLCLNFYDAKRTLRVVDVAAGRSRDVSTDIVVNGRVRWAGADRLLVNQSIGNRIGLVVVAASDGSVTRVPTEVEYVADMDVSADGRILVYRSYENDGNTLWLTQSDGGSPRRLTAADVQEIEPQITGDVLVFARRESAGQPYRLWRRRLAGGEAELLSDTPARVPRVSPDGSLVLAEFTDAASGNAFTGVLPLAGGEITPIQLPAGHALLCWNPAGDGFTTMARSEEGLVVWNVPRVGGVPEKILDIATEHRRITDAAWSPDGRSLALCLEVVAYDAVLMRRAEAGRQ